MCLIREKKNLKNKKIKFWTQMKQSFRSLENQNTEISL